MFAKAYEQHGALPWPDLFEDAITVAEDGYVLTEYRYGVLNKAKHLHESPDFKRLFFDADTIKPVGSVLKNEALASTFKTIAQEGIAPFYQGVIAESIVQKVHGNSLSKGYLSLDDLAIYQAKERDLICSEYRTYKVCGIGPPSSGGIAIAQALGILSQFDLPVMKANSGQAVHLILEAEKLAYADRNHYVADSDFITVPVGELLAPSYLKERANLIDVRRAMDKTEPGVITVSDTTLASLDYERPSTTHLSIIDTKGNAVSLTSSIEYAYGSGLSVGGFLLNNQLTDFSFYSEVEGKKIANRVEGGKRPRSSMSPTLVFNADGSLKMIVGSPGGSRIITYVLKTLIQVLDWNMPIEEAVASPHYLNRNGITELENVAANEILGAELLGYGHDIIERPLKSGLHAIVIHDDGTLSGAADPRREGAVLSNQ
jgi:gamma-glutamyltranspeptidase/glutathione hydrolase